jgi:hypothetical protein
MRTARWKWKLDRPEYMHRGHQKSQEATQGHALWDSDDHWRLMFQKPVSRRLAELPLDSEPTFYPDNGIVNILEPITG